MMTTMPVKLDCEHEDLPYRLEELSEGLVRYAMGCIESAEDKDDFPCCCQCGKFRLRKHGQGSTYEPAEGYIPPREIYASKRGDAFSLCVYQVAQARREGKPAKVVVDWGDRRGTVQCMVEISGELKDIVAELEAQECGCAGAA